MSEKHYVACDLGAESGRVLLGSLHQGKLQLEQVHRFPNGGVQLLGSLRWNVLELFQQIKQGLCAVANRNVPIASLSVDSWAVDYVLLNAQQPQLSTPYHYRDTRTSEVFPAVTDKLGCKRIFAETGIQFLPFNTIYQLAAEAETSPHLLGLADCFLPIADYFHYLFCGHRCVDASMASTTQLYNPHTNDWSHTLIDELGLPASLFPRIVSPGTKLGSLSAELRGETGITGAEVIATCSHDTGAAVAAVPAEGDDWAYLSSGTWSLIGVEIPTPLITDAARQANFTNEVGFDGTIRFLKNISGLWLLQQCRSSWMKLGKSYEYAELGELAAQTAPFRSLVHPNAARLAQPDDMPAAISNYCRDTGQPAPETPGQFTRCIYESLALLYAQYLDLLEQLTDRQIKTLHIVGGGCQSQLLNQFAASATGRTVHAGPVEATAIGNLLIQAIAMGDLGSHAELRDVVRRSCSIKTYHPQDSQEWGEAASRFSELEIST